MTSKHRPDKALLAAWVDKDKRAAFLAAAKAKGVMAAEALEQAIAAWTTKSGVNT